MHPVAPINESVSASDAVPSCEVHIKLFQANQRHDPFSLQHDTLEALHASQRCTSSVSVRALRPQPPFETDPPRLSPPGDAFSAGLPSGPSNLLSSSSSQVRIGEPLKGSSRSSNAESEFAIMVPQRGRASGFVSVIGLLPAEGARVLPFLSPIRQIQIFVL